MITKRNTIICDHCGLFCRPVDEYTPFGCNDPEAPEPLDPSHVCKKCFPKFKAEWIREFKQGYLAHGDWQKSRAEVEAAKECNLIWIHDHGIGNKHYCYVTRDEFKKEIKSTFNYTDAKDLKLKWQIKWMLNEKFTNEEIINSLECDLNTLNEIKQNI